MLRIAIVLAAVIASAAPVRADSAGAGLTLAQADAAPDAGAPSAAQVDAPPSLTPSQAYDINREFDGYYSNVPGEP